MNVKKKFFDKFKIYPIIAPSFDNGFICTSDLREHYPELTPDRVLALINIVQTELSSRYIKGGEFCFAINIDFADQVLNACINLSESFDIQERVRGIFNGK